MATEYTLPNTDEKELYKNKTIEEKEKILLEMVLYAEKRGNKPAARKYKTYPSTVRRWRRIYNELGVEALKINKKK